MNTQGWFPLGLTGLISLQSKRLLRVFSSTIQKHQFFLAQSSLWSRSHTHTWLASLLAKWCLCFFNTLSRLVIALRCNCKIQPADFSSVQFSSVAQSCPTLCDPINCSTPRLPVHHHLPEFTQTHVHQVGDAIQPSHPLSPPFPPASNPPSIRVFSNESTLCMRWWKYWSFNFSIIPSKNTQGWFPLELTGWISLKSKGLSRVFSNTTVQKHQFFSSQLS